MPAPAPFPVVAATSTAAGASATNNAFFPAVYLYPLNDSWAPKHIALTNQHTKIGRQTSSKTAPGERNGFFDSKVLSRQHAEVWEENGKIYIKDVKSSNGTFINGERLSSEGQESEPFELKSDDIVEFGIDIVGEDNTTIIHRKVAARVVCIFSEQDAQVAARAEQHQQQHQQQQQQLQQHQFLQQQHPNQQHQHPNQHQQHQQHPGGAPNGLGALVGGGGGGGVAGLPGSLVGVGGGGPQNFPFAAQRRQLAQQGLGSMGGMRPPGKTGLSFDVILSRLQGEVQKSRETGAELNSLTGTMGEIHDTLGGAVPANLPPFPTHLPPVRPPQETQGPVAAPAPTGGAAAPPAVNGAPTNGVITNGTTTSLETSASSPDGAHPSSGPIDAASSGTSTVSITVLDLQSQLRETQSSLAAHLEKVRALEEVLQLQEMETVKREVREMREMMVEEQRRRGSTLGLGAAGATGAEGWRAQRVEDRGVASDEEEDEEDEDDARSISTVVPHELERVDEEDEEQMLLMAEEEQMVRRHQLEQQERAESEAEAEGEPRVEGEEEGLKAAEGLSYAEAEALALAEAEKEEQERRKEDLDVGRPRTPEPMRMGLGLVGEGYAARPSLLGAGARKVPSASPLSQDASTNSAASSSEAGPSSSTTTPPPPPSSDADVYAQVQKLSLQVSSVLQLTSSLEAQHSVAQTTIRGLEGKVAALEAMLRAAEEALGASVVGPKAEVKAEETPADDETKALEEETEAQPKLEEADQKDTPSRSPPSSSSPPSLTAILTQWKKSAEGQWGSEWSHERERLSRAREEWEAKSRLVEVRLEEVAAMQSALAGQQEQLAGLITTTGGGVYHPANGGPPAMLPSPPRSQSSDSGSAGAGTGRYRRRRRSSSAGGRSRTAVPPGHEEDADTDTTLASSTEDDDGKHVSSAIATPEHSVYPLSSSVNSLDTDGSSSQASSPLKGRSTALAPAIGTNSNPTNPRRSGTSDTDDTASLLSFFDFSRGVLLMLFWSVLSFLLLLCSGVASLVSVLSRWSLALVAAVLPRRGSSTNWRWHKQHASPTMSTSPAPQQSGVHINMQTAVGVVLLSVAAAAVLWKVKPE